MTALRVAALLLVASIAPGGALAQKAKSKPKKEKKEAVEPADAASDDAPDDAAGDEAPPDDPGLPMDDGPPSDAPSGAEENPKAPVTEFDQPAEVEAKVAAPAAPAEYPIERALRPITLPHRMAEIIIEAPNSFNPYVQSGLLGARYGVTPEIQAGLRYGTGTLYDGEFYAGKAFSIDGEYRVFEWLAAQLSVPMLVDPFAAGITVGAPMKFTILDRLRFDLFRDLVTFKLSRFAPSVVDAAYNDRQVAADEVNSVLDDGEINVNVGATWQLQPIMAIEARFGVKGRDFEFQSDSPTAFDVGLIYSSTNKIDIGGRLGFADLNHTDASFGLWLLAAIRI